MIKSGLDYVDHIDVESATTQTTCEGSFNFQGKGGLADGTLALLVALQISGVKLTDLGAFDASGAFVQRGILTFEVSGTNSEVERFRRAYKS